MMMMSRVCVCVVSSFFLSPLLHLSPLLSCHLLLLLLGFLFALAIRTLNPSLSVSFASSLFPLPLGKKEKRGERGEGQEEEENKRKKREMLFFVHLQNMFYTCPFPEQERQAIQRQGKRRRRRRRGKRGSERERDRWIKMFFARFSLSLSLSACSASSFPALPSFL